MDTGTLLAGWCAFVVGIMAYRLLPVKKASPGGAAKRALQMQGYATGEEAPWWYNLLVLLEPLARRTPEKSLLKVEQDLYWAKLAGQFLRWDPVHFWCLRIGLAMAAVGFGVVFLGDPLLVGVLVALAFMAPAVVLRNRARAARKSFLRELPEIVELLRLEVSSGISISQALQALSERDAVSGAAGAKHASGLVSRWLRHALGVAAGRALFSSPDGRVQGALLEEAKRSGLPELISFAVQVDLIARRGVDPGPLLATLSASVAEDYPSAVDREAEKLSGTLIFPTFGFFFVPFMVAILLPLLPSLIGLFS